MNKKEPDQTWLVIFMLLAVMPLAIIVGLIIRFIDLFDFLEIKTQKGGD